MPNFVDDLTSLAYPKGDGRTPSGSPNEVTATNWNELCQAAVDLRGKVITLRTDVDAIEPGGGGESSWETDDEEGTIAPVSEDLNTLVLTSEAENSRDDPRNFIVFKNTGLEGNPRFGIGNPYVAGIGLEAWGVWYTDDDLSGVWQLIVSGERSGTFATVLDGIRRSAYESFINHGGEKPWMRADASVQGFTVGPGDAKVLVGNAVRSSGTLTCETETEHKFGVGTKLWKQGGDVSNFGVDGDTWGPASATMTVASVPDGTHFTVTDARDDATNTVDLNFSGEVEVAFARGARNTADIRVGSLAATTVVSASTTAFDVIYGGTAKLRVNSSAATLSDGVTLINSGTALGLGANSTVPVEVLANQFHVKEGMTFYNQGTYRSTGWLNGGSQQQTTQEVFAVDTSGSNKDTSIRTIDGVDWMVFRVLNYAPSGSNTLTVSSAGSDTIGGAADLVLPAKAGATLVSQGTNWLVFYHPPPP